MKLFFTFGFAMAFYLASSAQTFNFSLSGNPVNTTGWTMSNQSSVQSDEIQLTNNINDQAGYIYYSTPQDLANCSQFSVSFDFRITNSSIPTADGITFFYISNPPSGFLTGEGIGLPNNPNGLVTLLDTYDNNSTPDNPLVSLRRFTGVGNYVEGSTTGQLTPDATSQSFITDGNWHNCKIVYSFGTVTVSFDNNAPLLTGTTTLSLNGYFGFSASTGGSYAKHSIKNVSIMGAAEPNPPLTDTVFYCQNETAIPLTAQATNLLWYANATGGTALGAAPTPNTTVPGNFTWYVSSEIPGCDIESARSPITVVVHPKPTMPVVDIPVYCEGATQIPITVVSGENLQWYTESTSGTGTTTQPTFDTSIPDTFTYFITQTDSNACESDRKEIEIVIHKKPVPEFSYTLGYNCNGADTLFFQNNSQFATSYQWDFSDGNTSMSANPNHVFTQGSYGVLLTASSGFCTDIIAHTISVGHPLSANFTATKDTICQGTQIDFNNNSTATPINGIDPVYTWVFGEDTVVSSAQDQSYTFNTPGIYQVLLIAQNGIPCYDTFSSTIIVDTMPTLSFTSSDSVFCKGDKISLNALNTLNGLDSLSWNFGDSGDWIYNENPIQHAYETAGNYVVKLKATYRVCPETTAQINVQVNNLPTINLGPDTMICLNGMPFQLVDKINRNNPDASWNWNTGDTTSFLTIKHEGIYYAKVTVAGCSAKDEVIVSKDCYLDIPNSFTPNEDGQNDYFLPRQLLSEGIVNFQMIIYNRWGQKVFVTDRPNGRGWDGKFNDKEQPMGVYVYQIEVNLKNGRQEKYTGNVTLIR